MPIHDVVAAHAQQQPDAPAVAVGEHTRSYAELWEQCSRIYTALQTLLPHPGEKIVALILGNDIAFAEYYLAATTSPYVCAIIDPRLPADMQRMLLARLSPDIVIARGDRRAHGSVVPQSSTYWDVDTCELPCLSLCDVLPTDPVGRFFIGFTSGTTSFPKAIMRSKPAWRQSLEQGNEVFSLNSVSRTLCPCPLSHGIGLYCLNETLFSGGCFYTMPRWDAAVCNDLVEREAIERLVVVPSMIADVAKTNECQLSVGYLVTAGAKLDENKYVMARNAYPMASIQEYYGASEIGFMAVSTLDDATLHNAIPSVGMPFGGVSISIRDDSGVAVKPGSVGTIYVHSKLVADEYLWSDDGRSFKYEHGASVGDVGFFDEYGQLHVVGRKGGMVTSGGFNVYPTEIEHVIRSMPGVIEAVVIAMPDEKMGHIFIAFVETDLSDAVALLAHCKASLAGYKIPRLFYAVANWPMTTTGKIKAAALQALHEQKDTQLATLPTTL